MKNKPPPLPTTARARRFKTFIALLVSAIALVALGMKLEQLRDSISSEASFPADEAPQIPHADEARQLPTAPALEKGLPMIKTAKGTLVSLRPISLREFAAFADEAGLPDASYAWVRYNWGWEWKKGYSWRYSGETRGPGDAVTAISLQDAQAFCRWLTDKQREAGSLPAGQFYRVVESDQMALMLAVHGSRLAPVRDPGANMAPGFHIELAQAAGQGEI